MLNFNGEHLLPACLDSLSCGRGGRYDVVVADNGSGDGSLELLKNSYPWVRVIDIGRNRGFSVAYNIALRDVIARGDEYALLLNNDTYVAPDFVEEMLRAVEAEPTMGAVSPKIYFAHDPSLFWYAGGDVSLWTGTARHRGWKTVDRGQFDLRRDITLATGCAMLVRCSALRDVGLLDEQFWAYLEDVEWSLRFLKSGYRLGFAPKARVWHCCGATWVGSLGHGSQAKRQYLSTRNMLLLARKHVRWFQLPSYFAGFFLNHIAFYTALRLWRGDFEAIGAIYKGLWDGLRMCLAIERWRPAGGGGGGNESQA